MDPLVSEFPDIDPAELQNTLIGFLGQTYSDIAKFDNNIVSANSSLSPKKHEFQRLAERVISETNQHSRGAHPQQFNRAPVQPQMQQMPPQMNRVLPQHQPVVPQADADQFEFNFDNSITAKSINLRIDDLEKMLKRLDKSISKMISLLESHDPQNSQ
jgi:hypothetical protein